MTPTDDNTMPELPRSFLEEIKAVFGDVAEDFSRGILEIDSEIHTFYRAHTISLMSSGRDPNLIIDDFATTFVWMILLGREHALHGYEAPLPRHDVEGLDLISDASISQFIQDELDKELDQ